MSERVIDPIEATGEPTSEARPERRRRRYRTALSAVIAIGFVASAAVIWQSTWSAFSATTGNANNSLGAGTVSLTDNDNTDTIPMFTISNMVPGDSRQGCIVATYGGSLNAAGVKVYVAPGDLGGVKAAGRTNPLANYLKLEIYEGDATGAGNVTTNTGANDGTAAGQSCARWAGTNVTGVYNNGGADSAKTLAAFAAASTDYGTGVGGWAPTGGSNATKAYRFVLTLLDNNDAQGSTATAEFTWEARSN